MNIITKTTLALALAAGTSLAAPEVGQPAPAFTLTDSNGQSHNLADFKGKFVVLEWLNHGCPFVKKHYDSNNMQKLQKEYTGKDVVWLSIVSSAPGKQGHMSPAETNAAKAVTSNQGSSNAIQIDPVRTPGCDKRWVSTSAGMASDKGSASLTQNMGSQAASATS